MAKGRRGDLTEYRLSYRTLTDELSETDRTWHLCRATGRSYQDLMAMAVAVRGSVRDFEEAIGYRNVRRPNRYGDGGWWVTICAWIRMFLPQWETAFEMTIKDLATLPDPEAILAAASTALGIAPELLLHLAEHRDEIEMFLETQRSLLGTLAESKLWSLVAQGDAATIRWLLPRIKTDAYGDKLSEIPGDTPRHVKIIEVVGRND